MQLVSPMYIDMTLTILQEGVTLHERVQPYNRSQVFRSYHLYSSHFKKNSMHMIFTLTKLPLIHPTNNLNKIHVVTCDMDGKLYPNK
jgi:hypothetical protein